LEKRAEQDLLGNKWGVKGRAGVWGRGLGQRKEMAQTMYAHMNKLLKS
jgi:hypothetical protein